jgi:hypothetical protein
MKVATPPTQLRRPAPPPPRLAMGKPVGRSFAEVLSKHQPAPTTKTSAHPTTTTSKVPTTPEAGAPPATKPVAPREEQHKAEHQELIDSVGNTPPLAASMSFAPAPLPMPVVEAPTLVTARASLETLLPAMVKRIAWSGDGQRGAVRIELGSGSLSGAVLMLRAEAGRVSVHMTTPPGTSTEEWRSRIEARLKASGVDVEDIHVD